MPNDHVERLDRSPPWFESIMKARRNAMTDEQIRQGQVGHGVRYVLAVSLAATLIGLAIVYWVFVL